MGIRAVIQSILRKQGYEFVRYPIRQVLDDAGVTVVLDVGANLGQYGQELRHLGYRGRIVSFEPQPGPFRILAACASADPLWDVSPLALGSKPGTATLNVSEQNASSSLLPILPIHVASAPASRYTGTVEVDVNTVDRVFDAHCRPDDVVFLKVDTQGFEREVLAGAAGVLGRVAGLQLEMSLVPLYDGGPLIEDLVGSLRAFGFVPVWLNHGFKDAETQRLLQVDGLFLRPAP